VTLPHAWEKTPRLSRCASSSLTGSQPWAKTLNLDFGHGESAGGQMSLTIGGMRGCLPSHGIHPLMRQRQRTTGLVCTPYLESCPRTAPLGNAALWTLT
jgi:hypothetical protein